MSGVVSVSEQTTKAHVDGTSVMGNRDQSELVLVSRN